MTPEEWDNLKKRIESWDTWRQKKAAEEKSKNCKHPNKTGTGSINSDGSSWGEWHCPDCGKSNSWTCNRPVSAG